jgi:flagellar basal-body rod protein FlgB
MLNPIADRLERYLDLLSARQKLVASNLANADTPGYKTQDIDFRSEFQNALAGKKVMPAVVTPVGLKEKTDGNNVSVDREARLLAENALRFNVTSNLLKGQIALVRSAIQEGKNA